MGQCLLGSQSLRRTEHQQFPQKVDGILAGIDEKLGESSALGGSDATCDLGCILGLHGSNVLGTRGAQQLDDAFNLVESRVTREDRLAKYEFSKNAAYRPHINRL